MQMTFFLILRLKLSNRKICLIPQQGTYTATGYMPLQRFCDIFSAKRSISGVVAENVWPPIDQSRNTGAKRQILAHGPLIERT